MFINILKSKIVIFVNKIKIGTAIEFKNMFCVIMEVEFKDNKIPKN